MVDATIDKDKLNAETTIKEVQATIAFNIPAYVDEANRPFQRILTVPSKKAYAIWKKLSQNVQVE